MSAAKANKANGPADTSAPIDTIAFDDAVREGKQIVARIEARNEETDHDYYLLGELADKVETCYDDRTLSKFARAIGKSLSCVKRYRSVYRAWKGTPFGAPGPQSVSYSVLRELATLPDRDREKIIRDKPDITKREAEQLRRERKGTASSSGQQQGGFLKDKRRYLKDICTSQEELRRKAEEGLESTDEQQLDDLAQMAGELMLSNLRADAKVVVELADLLLERRRQLEAQGETEPEDADALVATEHAHAEASVQLKA